MPFCPNCGRSGVSEGASCPTCEALADVVDPDATIQRVPRTNQTTPSNKIVVRLDDPPPPPIVAPTEMSRPAVSHEIASSPLSHSPISAPIPPIPPIPPPRPSAFAARNGPAPSGGYAGRSAQKTSGMAIAALVCGILGVSAVAIILGFVALSQIKRSGGLEKGRGMALAGIILGFVWVAISIALTITLLALAHSASAS